MTKYNPNNYVVKVHTSNGTQLGYFNNSNVITGIDDKPLCTVKDIPSRCSYFTEVVLDVVNNKWFPIGYSLEHNGFKYFILESEERLDTEGNMSYSYIIGR